VWSRQLAARKEVGEFDHLVRAIQLVMRTA
jgi:hypothetical protein